MFDFALKFFLLLSPLVYQKWFPMDAFAIWFFRLGVMSLLAIALCQRPKRQESNKLMGLFLGLVMVNVFINSFAFRLFNPERMTFVYLDSFFTLFLGFVLYYLIINYAEDISGCLYWMGAACIINLFIVSLQVLGIDLIFLRFSDVPTGTLVYSHSVGLMMVLGIFLGFFVHWFMIIPFFMALFFISSDSGLFSAVGGVLFFLLKTKNWANWLIIALVLLLVIGVWCVKRWEHLDDSIHNLRWKMWGDTVKEGLLSPLKGHGVGNFYHNNNKFVKGTNDRWPSAKNELVQLVYELGLAGPVIVFLIIKAMALRAKELFFKNNKVAIICACLVAISINSLLQCPFRDPRFVAWIVALLGFFHILTIKKEGTCI